MITCPHCGAAGPAGALFCESCGKALPSPIPAMPRILSGDELPTSGAATKLVGDELTKQTKSSATMLLVVAIIQLIIGGVMLAVVSNMSRAMQENVSMPILMASTIGVAIIFLGLYFWARRSPLPATIVGIVVYGTLVALNVVTSLAQLAETGRPQRGNGIGGLGVGWLDIVILVILSRGISAALKQRKLAAV